MNGIHLHSRWWAKYAFIGALIALRLGLVRDADSAEHHGGRITAVGRVSAWLVDHAFVTKVY